MNVLRRLLLLLLMAPWFAAPVLAQSTANCGFLGRKIQFADGAEACVRDMPLFKRSGLIDATPNLSYESRISGSKSYAIAMTANPNMCPFSTFIAWDWTGHDASTALPGCDARLADAVKKLGIDAAAGCPSEARIIGT